MEAQYKYEAGELFLDKEGRWFHEGVEITHQLTRELFSRSLQPDPECGYKLVIGLEWAPVRVEDTPYMVRGVSIENDRALLHLNDGTTEELAEATLRQAPDNVLYCDVKECRFPARFLRPAYYQLMERLCEDGQCESGFAVQLSGRKWPIIRK